MHYAVPRILAQANLLGRFYTDNYIGNKPLLLWILKELPSRWTPAPLRRLAGREAPGLAAQVVSFDLLGLKTQWRTRSRRSQSEIARVFAETNRMFCERVAREISSQTDAVYALNGAAAEIFRAAKRRGIFCILEQTIAPARVEQKLMAEEIDRYGQGRPTTADQWDLSPLAEREEVEWQLADRIICGSEFVVDGLRQLGVRSGKCRLLPYGVDTSRFCAPPDRHSAGGLKVLFVGAVGLRKGVPYLLEALRKLRSPQIHCRLIGQVELGLSWLARYRNLVEVLGAVPRSEIMRMYCWADLLVLPSICEGSAVATYEALACALPVITTPNSGSVVRDGKEGFVVPIRDPDAIADRLQQFLEDRELLRAMSAQARRRSLEFSLDKYAQRLVEFIKSLSGAIASIDSPASAAFNG